MSVCPHVLARLLLDRFTWNFRLGTFIRKSIEKIQIWTKIGRTCRTHHARPKHVLLSSATINCRNFAAFVWNDINLLG